MMKNAVAINTAPKQLRNQARNLSMRSMVESLHNSYWLA
jgi:hypothetical protein